MSDAHLDALLAAAARAAGTCPPGGEPAWSARVRDLMVELHLAARGAADDIKRLDPDSTARFAAILAGVDIEEATHRGVLTLLPPAGEPETIRTPHEHTPRGHAMITAARALLGHWVLVHRYNEQVTGKQSVRMLAWLQDLGGDRIPVPAGKKVVLHAAGGDTEQARQAWDRARLPSDGHVSAAALQAACETRTPPQQAGTASSKPNPGA